MLSVTNCVLSLTRPCFPALQTLALDTLCCSADTPPPVLPLSLLEHLPSIRQLELCGAMEISDASDPVVELPHLEHLGGYFMSCGFPRVLKRILAPRLKTMELIAEKPCSTRTLLDVEGFFSILPNPPTSYWRVSVSIRFSRSSIRSRVPHGRVANIVLHISTYSACDAAPMVKAKTQFSVDAGEGRHTATRIFSLLPVGQPEFVQMECSAYSDLGGTLFKPIVDALARVSEIRFDCSASVPLFLSASDSLQMGETRSIETLPFPSLKRIYIMGPCPLKHQGDAAETANISPALRETLQARKQVHPLEVLKLGGGLELPNDELELLRQIVEVEILDNGASLYSRFYTGFLTCSLERLAEYNISMI